MLPQSYLPSPTRCRGVVTWHLSCSPSHISEMGPLHRSYVNMGKLASPAGHSADFSEKSARERMAVNPQKSWGSGTAIKVLGVKCLVGNAHVVPEAVMDKVQAYPIPKNKKEGQAFGGIWGFWKTFIPHLAHDHLVKKGHRWDLGSEQQAPLRR